MWYLSLFDGLRKPSYQLLDSPYMPSSFFSLPFGKRQRCRDWSWMRTERKCPQRNSWGRNNRNTHVPWLTGFRQTLLRPIAADDTSKRRPFFSISNNRASALAARACLTSAGSNRTTSKGRTPFNCLSFSRRDSEREKPRLRNRRKSISDFSFKIDWSIRHIYPYCYIYWGNSLERNSDGNMYQSIIWI